MAKNIFVFHISIEGARPGIWRDLRAPGDFTLADLHKAIQLVFGWTDSHLHSFTIGSTEYMMEPELGMELYEGGNVRYEYDYCLDDLGLKAKQSFLYIYDFGDTWEHKITVSKIIPLQGDEEPVPPLCLGGENACPLEDSGGIGGYAGILEILKDPHHEDYKDILEWAGEIDPLAFDMDAVNRALGECFVPIRMHKPGKEPEKKAGQGGTKKKARKKGPPSGKLKKLYALMGRVKELKPWEKLWDSEFVLIEFPGREEPVLCSVMGRDGQCFGIGVYPGFDSIFALTRMAGEEGYPFVSLGYQNWILCQLGARNELFPEERERLKELGISFRGKHDWVFFRKSMPGLLPWYINGEDADLLIETLTCFIDACTAFTEGGIAVDFEADQILTHRYSAKDGKWITEAGDMPFIPGGISQLKVDAAQVEPLRFKERTKAAIEADILYFPRAIGENKEGVPVLMRVIVLVDSKTRLVLDQRFLDLEADKDNLLVNVLFDYIGKYGRPAAVTVRDQFAAAVLEDFCRKIDVPLAHSRGMPAVDEFVREWISIAGT
jgi:hypothetical protein